MFQPQTICALCQSFLNLEPDSPREDVWYNHLCKASPLEERVDPVTGKPGFAATSDLGQDFVSDRQYQYCHNVNKGFCPLYKAAS